MICLVAHSNCYWCACGIGLEVFLHESKWLTWGEVCLRGLGIGGSYTFFLAGPIFKIGSLNLFSKEPSLQENLSSKVVLHSPSGDTNILILAASFLENSRSYIDYGNGKLRKSFWLKQINTINKNLKKPLIGFHAFTGNDYVSSLFRNGKKTC